MAENGFVRAFGDRGDMSTRNLLQFTFKGYWLFDERWAFYKAAWRTFFLGRGATEDVMALTKPQKPILTRWGYITLHLLQVWRHGRWNDMLFAAHMAREVLYGSQPIHEAQTREGAPEKTQDALQQVAHGTNRQGWDAAKVKMDSFISQNISKSQIQQGGNL
jgi:hypothetical protein